MPTPTYRLRRLRHFLRHSPSPQQTSLYDCHASDPRTFNFTPGLLTKHPSASLPFGPVRHHVTGASVSKYGRFAAKLATRDCTALHLARCNALCKNPGPDASYTAQTPHSCYALTHVLEAWLNGNAQRSTVAHTSIASSFAA